MSLRILPSALFRAGLRIGALVLGLATLSACTPPQPGLDINDPFEANNREVHAFNKGLDRAVLRPAGRVAAALPEEVRIPASNFAANAGLPNAIANGVLQGDIGGVATNTFRFILNTTIGIGGLFDPAGAIGLTEEETDFGETLHVWGVPEGAYIELPGLGPSTERDAAGEIVDLFLDPLGQLASESTARAGTTSRIADIVIQRGTFGDTIDGVLYESADSYAQSRLIYLQNRRFELGMEPPGTNIDGTGEIDPFALDLEGFE